MKKIVAIAGAAVLISGTVNAYAQDAHYWSNQYGSRPSLLGGAVVGDVRDTSAGYYNPGSLGFLENPSLSVSANGYKYSKYTIKDGAGAGKDVDSNDINVIPLLVSGIFKLEDVPRSTIGYSIITRESSEFKGSARNDSIIDVLTNPFNPGLEDYIGQINLESKTSEYWAGLSYAYKVDDAVSLGFTNFLALRNQKLSNFLTARAVNRDNFSPLNTGLVDLFETVDYTNVRLLWKLGAAFDLKPLHLGVTVTTPSVNIAGTGTVGGDLSLVNIDVDGSGIPDSLVADDRQESLDTTFKNPLSVAVGATYEITDHTKLAATVEWFDSVDPYAIITPDARDFVRPTGLYPNYNSQDLLKVFGENESVVNFAVGLETPVAEKLTGYISFRTDHEYMGDSNIDLANFDLNHITFGGIHKGEHSDIGVGLTYSWGNNSDAAMLADIMNPSEGNLLLGDGGFAEEKYQSISVLVGYTYYFS